MNPQNQSQRNNSNKELLQYAGLGAQLLVALGLAVFLGLKADKWLKIGVPVFAWLLPLLVLSATFYNIYRQTSKRKDDNGKK
ncbi:MAG: ATPase F0F1 [Chitinophagaceae bacterium]